MSEKNSFEDLISVVAVFYLIYLVIKGIVWLLCQIFYWFAVVVDWTWDGICCLCQGRHSEEDESEALQEGALTPATATSDSGVPAEKAADKPTHYYLPTVAPAPKDPGKCILSVGVVGLQYNDSSRVFDHISKGTILTAIREPDNPYDSNAIALYYENTKLGYVPRNSNQKIAEMMDAGDGHFLVFRVNATSGSGNGYNGSNCSIYFCVYDTREPAEEEPAAAPQPAPQPEAEALPKADATPAKPVRKYRKKKSWDDVMDEIDGKDASSYVHKFTVFSSYYPKPPCPPNEDIILPTRREARAKLEQTREELLSKGWRLARHPNRDQYVMEKDPDASVTISIFSGPKKN